MAKRMKSKIQPAPLRMTFSGKVDPDEDKSFYIDISQCASLLNRRFYRQGLNWAVAGFKMVARNTTGTNPIFARVGIHSLPNTWVMSNSWEKTFRTFMKQQKEAMQSAESIRPKFLDYKIFMSEDHMKGDILLPLDSLGNEPNYSPEQWMSSKIVIPEYGATGQAYEFSIGATGPTNFTTGYLGIIEGYAASRSLPQPEDPNMPADASTDQNWMTAMFNEGNKQDSEVLDNLSTEQIVPPYPVEGADNGAGGVFADTQYPGGANNLPGLEIVDENIITNGTIGLPINQTFKGGTFPCGLVELRVNNFSTGTGQSNIEFDFYVDLVPGPHRGYLAESMTEM